MPAVERRIIGGLEEKAARRAAAKLSLRVIGHALPYLDLAFLAWDAWDAYRHFNASFVAPGGQFIDFNQYTVSDDCARPGGWYSDLASAPTGNCSTNWFVGALNGTSNLRLSSPAPSFFQEWGNPRFASNNTSTCDPSKKWNRIGSPARTVWTRLSPIDEPMSAIDPLPPPLMPGAMPHQLPYWLLPYRTLNPDLSPTEQTDFGYDPPGTPRPRPPEPRPRLRPRKPPGPQTKEKKVRRGIFGTGFAGPGGGSVLGMIREIHHDLTEKLDLLDGLYDALPKDIRKQFMKDRKAAGLKGKVKPQEKAWLLYKNWTHVDAQEAVFNLVWNELTDRAIGGTFAGVQSHLSEHGIATGPAGSNAWFEPMGNVSRISKSKVHEWIFGN